MSKKKMSPKKIIALSLAGVVVVGVVGMGILNGMANKNKLPEVTITQVKKENLQTTIDVSGKTESRHKKTYFSPVNAVVEKLNANLGEGVNSGTQALSFNLKDLESNNKKAQLSVRQGRLSAQDTIEKANEAEGKIAQAAGKVPSLQAQVDEKQEEVNELLRQQDEEMTPKAPLVDENELNEAMEAIAEAESLLNEKETAYSQASVEKQQIQNNLDVAKTGEDQAKVTELVTKLNEKIVTLSQLEREKSQAENDLKQAQKELEALQASASSITTPKASVETTIALQMAQSELASLQGELATAKSAAEASSVGMTAAGVEQLNVDNNLKELEAKSVEELIAEGKKGIIPDFNGIISDVKVAEGASVTQGQELFTLSGLDDVCVKAQVNKNDLEKIKEGQSATIKVAGKDYKGQVDKISRIAAVDEKGNTSLTTDIKITNADNSLFLGVDAKVKIVGAEAKNVLVLPAEAVNISNEGNFVYILKDGVISKKIVEVGLSTDMKVEVRSGLKENDVVVTDLKESKEGDKVVGISEKDEKAEEK